MNLTNLPEFNCIENDSLTSQEVIQFVAKRGFSSIVLDIKEYHQIDLQALEQSDIVFIYINEYLKDRKGLLKLLLLNSRPNQLIIGVLDRFDRSAFFDFFELGVEEFIFEPIMKDTLVNQLDPLIHHLIEKNESYLNEIALNFPKEHLPKKNYLLGSEIIRQAFIYSSNAGVLSSDLTFSKKVNDHLLFVLGKAKDNSMASVLEAARMYSWLEEQMIVNATYSEIVEGLSKCTEMCFEVAMVDCNSKELTYIGGNDLVIIRNGNLILIKNESCLKLEVDDTIFLYSKGCYQQVGEFNKLLGKEAFLGFLKMIQPHDAKGRRRRLNYFYEAFLKSTTQNEDISLLSFSV